MYDDVGVPFADDGDRVTSVSGVLPPSHVEGDAAIFAAARLGVREPSAGEKGLHGDGKVRRGPSSETGQ